MRLVRGQRLYPSLVTMDCPVTSLCRRAVAVADTFNHRLIYLNSDLEPIRLIGVAGHRIGEFSFPRGLACDGAHLYVVETGCALVRIRSSPAHTMRTLSRTHAAAPPCVQKLQSAEAAARRDPCPIHRSLRARFRCILGKEA